MDRKESPLLQIHLATFLTSGLLALSHSGQFPRDTVAARDKKNGEKAESATMGRGHQAVRIIV